MGMSKIGRISAITFASILIDGGQLLAGPSQCNVCNERFLHVYESCSASFVAHWATITGTGSELITHTSEACGSCATHSTCETALNEANADLRLAMAEPDLLPRVLEEHSRNLHVDRKHARIVIVNCAGAAIDEMRLTAEHARLLGMV